MVKIRNGFEIITIANMILAQQHCAVNNHTENVCIKDRFNTSRMAAINDVLLSHENTCTTGLANPIIGANIASDQHRY